MTAVLGKHMNEKKCWNKLTAFSETQTPKEKVKALIEKVKNMPPMTDEEKFEQRVSWVYGQVRLSGSDVTKEFIREIVREKWDGK